MAMKTLSRILEINAELAKLAENIQDAPENIILIYTEKTFLFFVVQISGLILFCLYILSNIPRIPVHYSQQFAHY